MATYRITSYAVTLRTLGLFTASIIEVDLDGFHDRVLIQYDVPDGEVTGLHASFQPGLGLFCGALRSDYPRHLDLLRNESPVFLKVGPPTDPGGPAAAGVNMWSLATAREPLGEGPKDADAEQFDAPIYVFLGHEFGFVEDIDP